MLQKYFELTKPRIVQMVLLTTALGFFLARGSIGGFVELGLCLLATALVAGGSSVLNNYLERDTDALMDRTKNRPIPSGAIAPSRALAFGVTTTMLGIAIFCTINLLTAFLALLGAFLYVLVYTPMKRVSAWNTFVGAIPGALPPVWGWTSVQASIEPGAVILFLILFAWQHPHFFAIAWMYRDDYRKAGFRMLPVVEHSGFRTILCILAFLVVLLPVSLLPWFTGMLGITYAIGISLLGVFFLKAGVDLARTRTFQSARSLLRASVIYFPLMLVLIAGDTVVRHVM